MYESSMEAASWASAIERDWHLRLVRTGDRATRTVGWGGMGTSLEPSRAGAARPPRWQEVAVAPVDRFL